jgi:hypothetical protein
MRRGRALVGASVVCAALVLAGCDSTDDPTSAPTPTATNPTTSTTSASPTTSAGPSPSQTSTIPAAARKHTSAGAAAFLRYYFRMVNRAWTGPDSEPLEGLGTAKCEFCNKTLDGARYLESHGERYGHNPVTLTRAEPFAGAPEAEQYLRVEFKQNPVDVLDSGGAVVRSDPSATISGNAAVRWSGGRWLLRGIEAG